RSPTITDTCAPTAPLARAAASTMPCNSAIVAEPSFSVSAAMQGPPFTSEQHTARTPNKLRMKVMTYEASRLSAIEIVPKPDPYCAWPEHGRAALTVSPRQRVFVSEVLREHLDVELAQRDTRSRAQSRVVSQPRGTLRQVAEVVADIAEIGPRKGVSANQIEVILESD